MSREVDSFEVRLSAPDDGAAGARSRAPSSYEAEYSPVEARLTRRSSVAAVEAREASANPEGAIRTATFNLANTIMGAGLTGLPYVMTCSGIIPFLMFMSFSAGVGYMTLKMLVLSCNYMPGSQKDYQAVGRAAFGGIGLKLTAFATCLSCYGSLTAYFVLVGQSASIVYKLLGFGSHAWMIQVFAAVIVVWPLCCLKDISVLGITSALALLVYGLMTITAVCALLFNDNYYFAEYQMLPQPNVTAPNNDLEWFPRELGVHELRQLPTIIFAFNCQYAFLPLIANIQGSSQADLCRVCKGGLGIAYTAYVVLAFAAYACYRSYTQNMILLNFRHCDTVQTCADATIEDIKACPKDDLKRHCEDKHLYISLLNVLFLFAVLMGYPCVHFALRKAQVALSLGVDAVFSWAVHIGIATFNVLLTLTVAIVVGDNVSIVFRWTGAVASPFISIILPALFYTAILGSNGEALFSQQRLLGIGIVAYGCMVTMMGIFCNLQT